jgi:hypothetical protein
LSQLRTRAVFLGTGTQSPTARVMGSLAMMTTRVPTSACNRQYSPVPPLTVHFVPPEEIVLARLRGEGIKAFTQRGAGAEHIGYSLVQIEKIDTYPEIVFRMKTPHTLPSLPEKTGQKGKKKANATN